MEQGQKPPEDETYDRDRERVEKGFWPKVRRALGRVPFLEDAVAAYYCAIDAATPFHVKAVAMGALAYFVLPTDMVPDFIAGFGFTDDAAVFFAAWRTIAGHVEPRHREAAKTALRKLQSEKTLEN